MVFLKSEVIRDVYSFAVTQKTVELPVLVGSGITTVNLHAFMEHAHGFIVGSDLKRDGKWYNEQDEKRVQRFMEAVKKLRENGRGWPVNQAGRLERTS